MWQLKMRGNEIREWSEVGSFNSIGEAARRVLELEGRNGVLSFRTYVDPCFEKSDADILCRLEHQGANAFYLLTRGVQ